MLAITHVPSPRIEHCRRTYVAHAAIDCELARRQHEAYCRVLADCGAQVHTLSDNAELPDSAFVEDTALVLEEVAVLASMGEPSRRAEPEAIAPVLARYREVHRIPPPATLEGGDVLVLGRTLLVGLSTRTNAEGVAALQAIVRKYGYRAVAVPVRDCLHLKTACTTLPDSRLLINPAWLDTSSLDGFPRLAVPEREPWAANVVTLGERVCMSDAHPRTTELVQGLGFDVTTIELSEFGKAEAGVTCLSLLVP